MSPHADEVSPPVEKVAPTVTVGKRARLRLVRKKAPTMVRTLGSYFRADKRGTGPSTQEGQDDGSDMEDSDQL